MGEARPRRRRASLGQGARVSSHGPPAILKTNIPQKLVIYFRVIRRKGATEFARKNHKL